nr:hypothetical protein StreXyl84_72610 [Streptomyces sp. Xyl84]
MTDSGRPTACRWQQAALGIRAAACRRSSASGVVPHVRDGIGRGTAGRAAGRGADGKGPTPSRFAG